MKLDLIRPLVFGVTAFLVVGGYVASQWFFFAGQPSQWAKTVDVPSIKLLAMVLLIGLIALGIGGGRK